MANWSRRARRAAQRHGIDPDIFDRQMRAESNYDEDVIRGRRRSSAGAQGIAQIMPATARAWGVDPLDPDAALDAAARAMAKYVRDFGSYRLALAAYNAGPGAARKAVTAYPETRNYVQKILQGRDPGSSGVRSPSEPRSRVELGYESKLDEKGFEEAQKRFALGRLLAQRRGPRGSVLLRTGVLTTTPPAQADFTSQRLRSRTVEGRSPRRRGGGGSDPNVNGELLELFYNGPGGVNVKNGQRVGRGFVSGHTGHVHVASDRATVRALGRMAQEMGLHVGEHGDFGGTPSGGHAENSYHYKDMAIDVSGDPAKMRAFNRRVNYLLRGR